MNKDAYFIKKTFQLAKKGEGFTSPNPLVGAIIVKGDRIISQGYHKKAGFPHAEAEAIRTAGENLTGTTLYVNLEPCCHFGRTPPCVDEIIKKGIKRVVVATCDPNPLVRNKSITKLKKANIGVKVGLCEKEAEGLNEIFFKNMREAMPFVAAKTAQSLDGKIAARGGKSKWITNEKSRMFARRLRDKYDCVLVGANTVVKDNPYLNGLKKIPYKVVIDPYLCIPESSHLLKGNLGKLVIFTSFASKKKVNPALARKGGVKKIPPAARVFFLKQRNGWFVLREVLKILYQLGIMSVFVEGGSQTMGRFFMEKLVDKVYFFISPKIIAGTKALSSVGAEGFSSPNSCPYIEGIKIHRLDEDILISGYPCYKKICLNC